MNANETIESLKATLTSVLQAVEAAGCGDLPAVIDARAASSSASGVTLEPLEADRAAANFANARLDEALAEIGRLCEVNRILHRRAQQAEGPAVSYQLRLEYLQQAAGKQWIFEFDRLMKSFNEMRRIFRELARAYEYPMNGESLHSLSDMNASAGGQGEGVFANCFLTQHGGLETFRILDEVRRAVDELLALRAADQRPGVPMTDGLGTAQIARTDGSWETALSKDEALQAVLAELEAMPPERLRAELDRRKGRLRLELPDQMRLDPGGETPTGLSARLRAVLVESGTLPEADALAAIDEIERLSLQTAQAAAPADRN